MEKKYDLTGKVFGFMTVLKYAGWDKRASTSVWACRCICGKETIRRGCNIRKSSPSYSCGCKQVAKPKPLKTPRPLRDCSVDALKNHIVKVMMKTAKQGGKPYEINKCRVKELIDLPCEYCGTIGSNIGRLLPRKTRLGGEYRYNGIDRIDSSKGYIEGNVVPCCYPCNKAKSIMSPAEYIAHCAKVIAHQQSR